MPVIKTARGKIRYKTIPLFFGIKQIDKVKAYDNLKILKGIMDSHNMKPVLAFGTLLGAVREKDFISYDEDIDLIVRYEEQQSVLDILPELLEAGFRIARYDRRYLLSVMRNGEYIDFYFYKHTDDNLRYCGGMLCPDEFIDNIALYQFKDDMYWVPEEYEKYLVFEYGADWRTPVQYNNYELSWWRRILYKMKEHIKDILPDALYFYLSDRKLRTVEKHYMDKVREYRSVC